MQRAQRAEVQQHAEVQHAAVAAEAKAAAANCKQCASPSRRVKHTCGRGDRKSKSKDQSPRRRATPSPRAVARPTAGEVDGAPSAVASSRCESLPEDEAAADGVEPELERLTSSPEAGEPQGARRAAAVAAAGGAAGAAGPGFACCSCRETLVREEGDACDACNRGAVAAARCKLSGGAETKSTPVTLLDEEALEDYEGPGAADPVRPTTDELRLAAMLLAEEKKQDVEEKVPLVEEGAPDAGSLNGVDADGLEGSPSPASGPAPSPGRLRRGHLVIMPFYSRLYVESL